MGRQQQRGCHTLHLLNNSPAQSLDIGHATTEVVAVHSNHFSSYCKSLVAVVHRLDITYPIEVAPSSPVSASEISYDFSYSLSNILC